MVEEVEGVWGLLRGASARHVGEAAGRVSAPGRKRRAFPNVQPLPSFFFFFFFFFFTFCTSWLGFFPPPTSPNRVTREGSITTSALGSEREREKKQSDNVIQKDEGGVIWPEVVPQWWHRERKRERGNYDVYHLTSRRKRKKKKNLQTSVYHVTAG